MAGTKAIIYADQATAQADLDWTYAEEGLDGNAIGIKYVNPGAVSSALAVTYSEGVVSVSLKTDSNGDPSGTADELKLAILGVKATTTLTTDNTELADGETVTIGGTTYRFKDTPEQAYDVQRHGTTADTTLGNLVKAINGTGTTEYYAGTLAHSLCTAGTVGSHATILTARHAGTGPNAAPTTTTAAHLSFADTTFGGGTGVSDPGVAPTIDQSIGNLFYDIADHSGHDGTGILAAMTVKYASSSGGTPGVNTIFDSAAEMMAAGWILPDSSVGAVIIQNDQPKATAGANQLTQYEASVFIDGGRVTLTSGSAAGLREATKTYAIQLARAGRARCWAPRAWYSPALYTR